MVEKTSFQTPTMADYVKMLEKNYAKALDRIADYEPGHSMKFIPVEFVSLETLVNVLEGYGVAVEFDGTEAVGVWEPYETKNGSRTHVRITKGDDPLCVLVGTDVENFTKIIVL